MADNSRKIIQLYRTYQLGTVASGLNLGEIALNYNPQSPFIMFADNNGDIQKVGAMSSTTGRSEYMTMTQKAITEALSSMGRSESSDRAAQDDKIEASIGLSNDGSYIVRDNSNYINDATTVVGAIDALDKSLKSEETARINYDNSLQRELDKTQSGAGLNTDGSYVSPSKSNYIATANNIMSAVTLLDSALKSEETVRIKKDSDLQSELNLTQQSIGLNDDGSYKSLSDSNYLQNVTTVLGAITSLDEKAKEQNDSILAIEDFIGMNDVAEGETPKTVPEQITEAIESLDVAEIGEDGSYISFVSETNGVVNASTRVLVNPFDKILTYDNDGIYSTLSIAKLSTSEVTNLGESNVKEAYKLIGNNNEQLGDTIKIYKDQALKSVELIDITEDDGTTGQFLKYVYIVADGSESEVYVDVSKFLTESEYGDGLKVVNHKVSARLGEDTTTNKNFLDLEESGSTTKALAVRSIDTDRTYTTEDITVKGGPLAKLLTDVGINKIDAGTDIQSLLMTLLCKEIYPYNSTSDSWYMADEAALGNQVKVSYSTPNFTNSIGAPSISNFKTGVYEPGTKFTFTVTTPTVTSAKTASTISNLTWGYSVADDDSADSTATSITKNWTSSISTDVYTLKTTVNSGFNGITKENVTGTNSSRPSYSLEVQVADGANKITWSVTGCNYTATVAENPSVYMVSNLGKTDAAIKTNAISTKTITPSQPTNSTNKTVTGTRHSFAGTKQGTTGITNTIELTSANIRALGSKGTGNTFSITIADGTSHVYIALPPGKTLTKVADKGAFGTDIVASFKANTYTNIAVEGANNYTSKNYTVYIYAPDALLGSNTYDVTIS